MKLVELSDCSLCVEPIFIDEVADEDTLVVFLHEALGSIGQWKSFPTLVCQKLKLNGLVYERQGYGKSSELSKDRGVEYLHEYAWKELPELIETIVAPNKKILLVGHSDGGSIALLYGAKYPERVKGIVSMAAHVIVEDVTLQGIQPAMDAFALGKLDGLYKYHGEKTKRLFHAWCDTWNMEAFKLWNICQDIQSIKAPILAIQGVNDQYGTALQVDLIHESAPDAPFQKLMIPKCGHHPHLESQQEVLDSIINWYNAIF
ncbi:MAG TPA: alpha/beta hydrolase [Taishania sp.]|nr:alpha/beta hydrolase [Taishania sp.]